MSVIPVQFKRGLKADLPVQALPGEILVTLDTGEVFLGGGVGIPLKRVAETVMSNTVPGVIDRDKIWVDTSLGNVVKVYKGGTWQVISTPASSNFGTF